MDRRDLTAFPSPTVLPLRPSTLGFDTKPGDLCVALARAGVGRTAFLVQVGLDALLQGRTVFHVAKPISDQELYDWYDALLSRRGNQVDRDELFQRLRIFTRLHSEELPMDEMEAWLGSITDPDPAVVLVDGFDWEGQTVFRAAELGGMRSLARRHQAPVWMTARTFKPWVPNEPWPLPVDGFEALFRHAVALVPQQDSVQLRIIKKSGVALHDPEVLELEPEEVGLVRPEATPRALPRRAYTLLSGAAAGAEEAFGECAEAWGLTEVHFSFPGRLVYRKRGLVELSEEDLQQGLVGQAYVESQLGRRFSRREGFEELLGTIWHQVATAGEVFIVGVLLPDGTVNGGTGWAAELAKHFMKTVHVFDQGKERWLRWDERDWVVVAPPRIRKARFTGTGTRYLNPAGKAAIVKLFEDTFGPKPT